MDVPYVVRNWQLTAMSEVTRVTDDEADPTGTADEAEPAASPGDPVMPAATPPADVTAPAKPKPKKKKKKKKAVLPEAPPVEPHPRALVTWPRVCGAAVLVVLLAAVAVLGIRTVHNRRIDSARSSALSTAQKCAKDFGTYDYRNLDAGFALIASELTGTFKTTYSSTAQSLKATVVKYQEKSTATVQGAAVSSVSPHHAVVIVLLDQSVTSVNSATPVVNRNRAVITLVRTGGGRWLMSGLDLK
jgi:Mce-associated membrane protein